MTHDVMYHEYSIAIACSVGAIMCHAELQTIGTSYLVRAPSKHKYPRLNPKVALRSVFAPPGFPGLTASINSKYMNTQDPRGRTPRFRTPLGSNI